MSSDLVHVDDVIAEIERIISEMERGLAEIPDELKMSNERRARFEQASESAIARCRSRLVNARAALLRRGLH